MNRLISVLLLAGALFAVSLAGCREPDRRTTTAVTAPKPDPKPEEPAVDPKPAEDPTLAKNPLLLPWPGEYGGLPPFDQVKLEHFRPALEKAMADTLAALDRIAADPAAPTFANTFEPYERAFRVYHRVRAVFGVWSGGLNTPEFQALELELAPMMAAFQDRVTQHEKLFRRLEAAQQAPATGLTPEQQRLQWKIVDDFRRAGAALDPAAKARLSRINLRLAELFTRFGQNVLADENDQSLVLDKESDLAGLPQSFKDAAAAEAKSRNLEGKWVIRNTRSSVDPVLTFADRRDLREKAWRMFTGRGDGAGGTGVGAGKTDNKPLITEILALRLERAKLLGYPTHAHWRLQNTMAKTPEAVMSLLDAVWKPARARVTEEVRDMQALANRSKPRIKIEACDYKYFAEKVRKQKFALDENQIKPYLQLDKMRDAMFWVAQELFELTFTRLEGAPVFHPDVTVWLVSHQATKRPVGVFYFDPFARAAKRSGAWASPYRLHEAFDGAVLPVVSNNCNFLKGKAGEPVLISWTDATTLFHEFGHALHGLLSAARYPSLAGTQVFRDYVELPSQILEHWLPTPGVLGRFALHVETGKPIPDDLVKKLERAATFNQGYFTVEFLASAYVDLKLHLSTQDSIDPAAFERDTLKALGMPAELVMRHRTPHFQHVFGGDSYSAGYYSYLWADVLTADGFDAFLEGQGPMDKAVARRFRDHVLSVGNTIDPAEGYRKFRGKDPTVAPLMRKRGFPAPAKPVPVSAAPATAGTVRCVGQLTEHEPEHPWFDHQAGPDGHATHEQGRAPLVGFRLQEPAAHRGRVVGVLFKYHGKDLPLPPPSSEKGKSFSFELPGDFFSSTAVTIDNLHVKDLKRMDSN